MLPARIIRSDSEETLSNQAVLVIDLFYYESHWATNIGVEHAHRRAREVEFVTSSNYFVAFLLRQIKNMTVTYKQIHNYDI